jgi:hypothetical protein
MYKGIDYTTERSRIGNDGNDDGARRPKSIYNFIVEMVEAKIAQRSRFKPAITVIPATIDTADENRAESSKQILTAKAQEVDLETTLADGDRFNFLTGESYTYIPWNKNIGGINKLFKDAIDQGLELKYEDGTPIPAVFKGDMDIQVLGPDKVYYQLGKKRWKDVDDCTVISWIHIDELKADYPEKANDISATDSFYHSYFTREERAEWSNHAMVVEYYYPPNRFLPKGAYIKTTPTVILEKTLEYPYRDGKLPVVFDTDIDANGEIVGRPFTANIDKLQRLHDMVSASMARGYALSNSPKWMYPKGSIDPNKLSNQFSSLEYKGPVAPSLATFNGVNPLSMDLLNWTEKSIEKGSAVYGISRGEPPKGIKAAVALQFLDEQELQRESRGMAKRQRRTIEIYKMMLSRIQQFYTPGDGRILKYLGEDNVYQVTDLETMDISGEFDIRIENSSSLPDSKTGKIAAILDLNTATQADPMFGKEQIAQILDLGNDKRFKSENISSLKAAQTKIQNILYGTASPVPQEYDDFILEYPMFIKALRQREYKGEDQRIVGELSTYIKGMEFLMWKKAQMNPAFKQRIMMFNEYPCFYQVPLMAPAPAMPGQTPSDAARPAAVSGGPMESQQQEMAQQKQINQEN